MYLVLTAVVIFVRNGVYYANILYDYIEWDNKVHTVVLIGERVTY